MTEEELRQYGMRCAVLAREEPDLPMESVAFQASREGRVSEPLTLRMETARLIAYRVSKVFYDNPSPAARGIIDAIVKESVADEDQLRAAEHEILSYVDGLWLGVVSAQLDKLRAVWRRARDRVTV